MATRLMARDLLSPALSIRSRTVIIVGAGLAAVLALSIAAQTHLSMLGHGHSFQRILAWQLTTWAFWAFAAPTILSAGARLMSRRPRTVRDTLGIVWLGGLLLGLHSVFAAQLTLWIQPFVPVQSYTFGEAWVSQLPSRFVTNLLTYGLLVVLGGALWTSRRAQDLEVRESRLETELARAQFHALRLEIEPHFLFNTLNAITALVRLKDNRRAVDMLVDLGDFMRSNLDRPPDQFVTLATEVAWVKRYVTLQQTRYGDRLDVHYEIADDVLDCRVPTFLLLPIVENAFRHGLSRQAQRGRLEVSAVRDFEGLLVTVADDGVGIPTNFDLDHQTGTGLRNVRSRLEHLYGARAFLRLHPAPGAGTIVTVRVPLHADWEAQATA
jgi:signal transduction histidine kinase